MLSPGKTQAAPATAATSVPSNKTSTDSDGSCGEHEHEHYLWLIEQQDTDCSGCWNARVFSSAREKDRFLASFVENGDEKRMNMIRGCRVRKILCVQRENDHTCRADETVGNPSKTKITAAQFDFDYEGLVKRFELFRKVIEHEDDLLNQRMSWIILAQSFLMAAFISSSSSAGSDSGSSSRTAVFLYVTASVGLLTVLVTLPALVAAGKNIEVQQQIYFSGLPSDSLCRRLHGHDRDLKWSTTTTDTSTSNTSTSTSNTSTSTSTTATNTNSSSSSRNHLLPNTAFRSRFALPILTTVVLLSIVQVAGWCGLLMAVVMVEDD